MHSFSKHLWNAYYVPGHGDHDSQGSCSHRSFILVGYIEKQLNNQINRIISYDVECFEENKGQWFRE